MAVHLRKMMSNKYIHYGSSSFDLNKFNTPKNCTEPWNKPDPGTCLWASPIDSENGWKDWCIDNHFRIERLKTSFIFSLKPKAKILNLRTDEELDQALKLDLIYPRREFIGSLPDYYMDFEKLTSKGFDAIEVCIYSSRIYWGLYGWDCDSLLVLNPDCIVEL